MAISRYKSHRYNSDCVPSSGVFVIGLLVPSDAPVFVGGEAANGVAVSPFVQGRSISYHYATLSQHLEFIRAAKTLQVRGLVRVVNAAMLVFIISGRIRTCILVPELYTGRQSGIRLRKYSGKQQNGEFQSGHYFSVGSSLFSFL